MSFVPALPDAASIPGVPLGDAFSPRIAERLSRERIAAVITVEHPSSAAPLARALAAGGIRAIELAWRSTATLDALTAIREAVPEMLLGIGTLLSPEQVRLVQRAGADFGVAPGTSPRVVKAAREAGFSFAPGIQTASDISAAVEHGCRLLKFFPAATAGGLPHLRALHAPFAHLGLRYIALGGLTEENAADYLRESFVAAIGGSWIAPVALIREQRWDVVQQRAASAYARLISVSKEAL